LPKWTEKLKFHYCLPIQRSIWRFIMNCGEVLIVEDDEFTQIYFQKTLSNVFTEFVFSKSIEESICLLDVKKFEAIILDLNLSDGKGAMIIEHLESTYTGINFNTPLVVTSGNIDNKFLRLYSHRVTQSLSKPIAKQDIINIFDKIAV
jgi:CheY-like chemotaxis protein